MHSDSVKIESPCHESWDAMRGEGARRFCGVCQKDVHNLSAMGHDEAQALLAATANESLCVRYSSEADGTLRFRDLVPRASLTRRLVRTAFAAVALAACAPHGEAPLQGLGEAIIESLREQARPSDAGGCDLTTGPFTTFHLPPGHALCQGVGDRLGFAPRQPVPDRVARDDQVVDLTGGGNCGWTGPTKGDMCVFDPQTKNFRLIHIQASSERSARSLVTLRPFSFVTSAHNDPIANAVARRFPRTSSIREYRLRRDTIIWSSLKTRTHQIRTISESCPDDSSTIQSTKNVRACPLTTERVPSDNSLSRSCLSWSSS